MDEWTNLELYCVLWGFLGGFIGSGVAVICLKSQMSRAFYLTRNANDFNLIYRQVVSQGAELTGVRKEVESLKDYIEIAQKVDKKQRKLGEYNE